MDLSPTAQRMLDTLPDYYWQNDIVRRVIQARANEKDRMDAQIDTLKQGLVPTAADDSLKLLTVWEWILGLPIAPPGASVVQRQAAIRSKMQALNAATASDVLALTGGFSIDRDTPGALQDTLTIAFPEGSYQASVVLRTIQRAWPAHRDLLVAYAAGFTLDLSVLDTDVL